MLQRVTVYLTALNRGTRHGPKIRARWLQVPTAENWRLSGDDKTAAAFAAFIRFVFVRNMRNIYISK